MCDPLGLIEQLKSELGQPDLLLIDGPASSEQADHAAFQLAIALGNCRLFGVDVPDDVDCTLTDQMTLAAIRGAERFVEQMTGEVESFDFQKTSCDEHLLLATDWLEARMDIWAAAIAIEEGREAAAADQSRLVRLISDAEYNLVGMSARWDELLRANEDMFTLVVDTELLSNWRRALAPECVVLLPWWLDGGIERLAQQLWSDAVRDIAENR